MLELDRLGCVQARFTWDVRIEYKPQESLRDI